MKIPACIVFAFLVFGTAFSYAEPIEKAEAKLSDIILASKFSGKARITSNHKSLLRYAVSFDLPNGKRETYLVHSPVRLFQTEPQIGEKYTISRELVSGIWRLAVTSAQLSAEPANKSE